VWGLVNGDLGPRIEPEERPIERAEPFYKAPAITSHGALNEDVQWKAIDHILKQMNLKEPPSLQRIYDFAPLEKARRQLETKAWKP
jgi:hypothetical protein